MRCATVLVSLFLFVVILICDSYAYSDKTVAARQPGGNGEAGGGGGAGGGGNIGGGFGGKIGFGMQAGAGAGGNAGGKAGGGGSGSAFKYSQSKHCKKGKRDTTTPAPATTAAPEEAPEELEA